MPGVEAEECFRLVRRCRGRDLNPHGPRATRFLGLYGVWVGLGLPEVLRLVVRFGSEARPSHLGLSRVVLLPQSCPSAVDLGKARLG